MPRTPPYDSELLTEAFPAGEVEGGSGFSPGQLLGDRYRVEALLGRGGMGEVWRAYDLKLRVEVALKSLHRDLFEDEAGLELLRGEVRTAREVLSPNVCRLFDLVEVEDQELVSMEYIDGVTLLDLLRQRSPLELKEANEIASQFLAGLEGIHQADLVHRDIKPENIMLTRSGRVVIMDFGLTSPTGTGSMSGTPAYMAPEQARGEAVDARADVFSAGMVLAEMLGAERGPDESSRQSFWQAVREDPPVLPESPWRKILLRSVAHQPDERYGSAAELARALEEIAFRVEGAEDKTPYPGLAAFTEADTEFFFGREAEVEAVWKRLQQAHLLGLIGPSGSGKSSFVRAGLLPASPEGWSHVICTPGRDPFAALGRALEGEVQDEAEALPGLLAGWRLRHGHVLLVVDQFEELFTQNTPETQTRFCRLLGQAALDGDIHVLLSMRDDFLFHCQAHEPLRPLFSELTPLGPPTGTALRRALVQPALRCGYRFEDETIVEEMLAELTRERGALPLIAFTAARLWDERNRETGYLTKEAYVAIGGVGGALSQHAETTLEEIGQDKLPIVRELMRNLVTAQGTRAAQEREELLSVFGGHYPPEQDRLPSADEVLDALIDARLLTSYEVAGGDDTPAHQRIEIIHESLLSAWPRLVRWQTEDAHGAQLRDELRRAARGWDEKGRPEGLLWTGAPYREYQLWRERYPGGLTVTEKAFANAMTQRAEKRQRQRRVALTTLIVTLLIVVGVISGFWRRSVAQTRRAEAANLFSLAQLQLEDHPSAALAYATASLELADLADTRRLVVEARWRGPMEYRLSTSGYYGLDFSPDGQWLAAPSPDSGCTLWPSSGGPPMALEGSDSAYEVRFSPTGNFLGHTIGKERQELGIWSLPEGHFLRSLDLGQGDTYFYSFSPDGKRLFTSTEKLRDDSRETALRAWPLEQGEPQILARLNLPTDTVGTYFGIDPSGSRFGWADGNHFKIAPLAGTSVALESAQSLEHGSAVSAVAWDPQGRILATVEHTGSAHIWSLEHDPPELLQIAKGLEQMAGAEIRFDSSGTLLASSSKFLLSLALPDAQPVSLRRASGAIAGEVDEFGFGLAFDPESRWLATGHPGSVSLWPLNTVPGHILTGHEQWLIDVEFSPDGRFVVSTSRDGSVRLWPLHPSAGRESQILFQNEGAWSGPRRLAIAPNRAMAAIGTWDGHVWVLPLDGQSVRELGSFSDVVKAVAIGPRARFVAAGAGSFNEEEAFVRVWDLATGQTKVLDAGDGNSIDRIEFTPLGDLLIASGTDGGAKLRRWSVAGESHRLDSDFDLSISGSAGVLVSDISADGRLVLTIEQGGLWLYDLEARSYRQLSTYGTTVAPTTFDPTGKIVVSGDKKGVVRVGSIEGEEPHLLLGHVGEINGVAVSPDGNWIASVGDDKTIRLWPMPDLAQPPLHTLARKQLLTKIRTMTNLHAVEDPDSPSGWKIEIGLFPGWETEPTW